MNTRSVDALTDPARLDVYAQRAEPVEWRGHAALRLENGLALIPSSASDFRAEVWIGAEGPCYPGIAFRAADDQDFEVAYVQPHTSAGWDAVQYDAAFHGSMTWQIYHGPAYQAPATIPTGRWFRLRIDVVGERLAVAVDGQSVLTVNCLAHRIREGRLGVWTYLAAYFRDLVIGDGKAIPNEGQTPKSPPGALATWDLEGVGRVACESNGVLNLNRWRPISAGPARLTRRFHLAAPERVTFAFGFSDRLALALDGQVVFQGEHSFRGFETGHAGRGYIGPDDQHVTRDLAAGVHVLSAELEANEPFGWGMILSAPETVRWGA